MKNTKSFGTVARHLLLGVLTLTALTAAGCGDDPASPGTTTTSVVPKTGSVYNYSSYKTANGNRVAGSDSTYRFSTIADAASFQGKSNVVTFNDGSDDTHVAYEANGDLALWAVNEEGEGTWMSYPFGSRTPFALPVETVYADLGGSIDTITTSITAKHVGTQEITVGSEKFATQKVEFVISMSHHFSGVSGGSVFKTTFYYAPKIGMFVRTDEETVINEFDGTTSREGEIRTLTSYTLK
jgi:hypothetical protein